MKLKWMAKDQSRHKTAKGLTGVDRAVGSALAGSELAERRQEREWKTISIAEPRVDAYHCRCLNTYKGDLSGKLVFADCIFLETKVDK